MNKELRVLVIEDSEQDTLLLMRELEDAGYEPAYWQVDSATAMSSALEEQIWDVVICDHSLPGFNSAEALNVLRQKNADIPFIILSGTIGEDVAVNMMKAGANDYVMKDSRARLIASIEKELRDAEGRRAKRQAGEGQKQKQEELEDFFENAPVGLRWEGPDGVILRVNETELTMLGYTRDEYVGRNISDFHVDKAVAAEMLRQLRDGEMLIHHEARLRCKDGTIKDVAIQSNALRENGKFVRSRSFTRDITSQRQAQNALTYLAAIVESSDDAIIGTSLDGTILSWNYGAERMYGYQAEEVRGRSISTLTPSAGPEEFLDVYEQIERGEYIARYQTVRVRKNGTTIDVALTLSPIKDGSGKVVGVSAIEHDISAAKREDEQRLRLIQELTDALARIKTLRGLLPICASCKKIRDDQGYWQKVESYLAEHTNAEFTHGLCPECLGELYPAQPRDKHSSAG
jgi:two-component system, cell cycle sensor histidine kinase and response regulator CckA